MVRVADICSNLECGKFFSIEHLDVYRKNKELVGKIQTNFSF